MTERDRERSRQLAHVVNRDFDDLLFEAEDKDSKAFFEGEASGLVPWSREIGSDVLYNTSRHFLKLHFVGDIVASYAKSSGHEENEFPFSDRLAAPTPHNSLLDGARTVLLSAVTVNPSHAGAWFNLGIVDMQSQDYQKAEAAFAKARSLGGRSSLVAIWWQADAIWEQGRRDEAAKLYCEAQVVAPRILGIRAARAAKRVRSCGLISEAAVIFESALMYDHTHVHQVVGLDYAYGFAVQLQRLDPALPKLVSERDADASELLGVPASIWEARNRFYAVPHEMGAPSAAELTVSGLFDDGVMAKFETILAQSKGMRSVCFPFLKVALPGARIRALRRMIRSCSVLEGFKSEASHTVRGPTAPSHAGLYDKLGLFYAIYQVPNGNRMYAVPIRVEPLAPEEVGTIGEFGTGWREYVDRIIDSYPVLYRYGHPILRKVLPGAARRFLRRRIRYAESWQGLVDRVHPTEKL